MNTRKEQIICEYCGYKFYPRPEDKDEISSQTVLYFCPKCGEEFYIGMEVKENYSKYNKKEWQ